MNEQVSLSTQPRMNAQYRQTLDGLLTNAERDLRLARAALELHAANHLLAHGERPWPREARA